MTHYRLALEDFEVLAALGCMIAVHVKHGAFDHARSTELLFRAYVDKIRGEQDDTVEGAIQPVDFIERLQVAIDLAKTRGRPYAAQGRLEMALGKTLGDLQMDRPS